MKVGDWFYGGVTSKAILFHHIDDMANEKNYPAVWYTLFYVGVGEFHTEQGASLRDKYLHRPAKDSDFQAAVRHVFGESY
jgi:hypothetical protein